MSWNVSGWTENNANSRQSILLGFNCDILVLQETHLKTNSLIKIPGYVSDNNYFNNRSETNVKAKKCYGGVAILFKNYLCNLFHIRLIDKSLDGVIAVEFTHKQTHSSFIVIGCYLPPEQSVWGRDSVGFYGHLLNLIYQNSEADYCYICGDFNSRVGNKQDYISLLDNLYDRSILDFTVNSHGSALLEFLSDSRFCIVNGRINVDKNNFTFVHSRGRSVVDYFLVSIDDIESCVAFNIVTPVECFNKFCSVDLAGNTGSLSDHSVLILTISIDSYIQIPDTIKSLSGSENIHTYSDTVKLPMNDIFYERFKIETIPENFLSSEETITLIANLARELNDNVYIEQQLLDEIYNRFCNLYHIEMRKTFRSVNVHPKKKKHLYRKPRPFWNEELQNLWYNVRKAEREYVKSKGQQVSDLRQHYKQTRNTFDKTFRREERFFNKGNMTDLENAVKNNPRDFWKLLKKMGPHKKTNIPCEVYNENNDIVSDLGFVLNKWKSDYESLYENPIADQTFNDDFYEQCINNLDNFEDNAVDLYDLNQVMNEDEVKKVLKKSKNKKAIGIENLPNEVLKNSISLKILLPLFNKIFEIGLIPTIWRKAVLKPIPKSTKSDPRIPLQYRGISLLSTVYKMYSSILNNRLVNFCEMHNIFADEQNGFRVGRSCDDHCFVLSTIIRQRISNSLSTFVAFVDFKKAFDCVNRNLLFYKLSLIGIKGKILNSLKNIYSRCDTTVNINGFLTDFFPSKFGVRQGDCLSTTLFLLYVNDLVDELRTKTKGIKNDYFDVQCLLYADDLVFVAENEIDLQNMLNILSNWCKNWRMTVNVAKTNIIHFRKARARKTNFIFVLDEAIIKIIDKYRYLGLIFNEFLNFKITAEVLADAGGRALGAIYNKYKTNKGFGYETYTKLYNSGVIPVLDYGACVWGFKDFDNMNYVQNRAIRLFLGVHKFSSNLVINGDMGWIPSKIRRYVCIARYWNRIIRMDDSRLTKKVFLWDKHAYSKTWCSDIVNIFDSVSMINYFNQNLEIDLISLQEKLLNVNDINFRLHINSSPKLRTYIMFKEHFEIEPYLKNVINRGHRSSIAQLRAGILPLAIETGRFQNVPLEQRLCKLCTLDLIEDEVHLLFVCPIYVNFRNVLFLKANEIEPNFELLNTNQKLKFLMSANLVKYTAKFIFDSISLRRTLFYR